MLKPPETLVSLKDASIARSGRWLVRNVTLDVRPGEIVTLVGPNGSGKSTTVKMALGVLKPNSGQVARRPGLRVGYVPQTVAIDWTLPLNVTRFMRLTSP
ncbi:MAG: ATP-binding cassette domain-containing protein, partial [Pseudomonadota bacterium]